MRHGRARLVAIAVWKCAVLSLAAPNVAGAHALDLTTARVSLRDGHAEVAAEIDVVALVGRTGAAPRDAAALTTMSERELAEYVSKAESELASNARLEVDGAHVDLKLRSFPSPRDVRMLAAQSAGSAHAHPPMSVLRWESTRPLMDARTITVTMPSSLGKVLFTFVQPDTRLAGAGAATSFEVLRRAPAAPAVTLAASRPWWLAFLASAMAIAALLTQILPRRRARHHGAGLPSQPREGAR